MNTTACPGPQRRSAETRSWRRAGAVVLSIALYALLPAPAAHAAPGSATCTGSTHATYTPGLTFTPQTTTVNETTTVPSCTSTDTTLTGVITGPTITYPVPDASCLAFQLNPGGGSLVVHWNNGRTSTLTGLVGELTSTGSLLQNTATGTVAAGEFTGAAAVITWTYLTPNPLQCLLPGGVSTQDGTILVQITGV
ncbi:hypothetical protein [Actinosynnema sp. NPDC020468]|uniref:hypothetical protein n=1 Tax=Actinosynnema sp. NPDC020468 TaxID=3154488 RepID=UPI0034072289